MGAELRCTGRLAGEAGEVVAMLESDELRVRGAFRLRVALADVSSLSVADGTLSVGTPDGQLELDLGAKAARWRQRIEHPPTLADRLAVKAGHRVVLLDVDEPGIGDVLRAAGAEPLDAIPDDRVDVVLFQADSAAALGHVVELGRAIVDDGALWIVHPRGSKDPGEGDVLAAGRAAGLVDTRVARFSATHTAHRFQIPRAMRGTRV